MMNSIDYLSTLVKDELVKVCMNLENKLNKSQSHHKDYKNRVFKELSDLSNEIQIIEEEVHSSLQFKCNVHTCNFIYLYIVTWL